MSQTVSILTRYICRRVIVYYLSFVAMITVFFVFVDFMEHIDRIVKFHASLKLIGLYYACLLPRIFTEVSWMGLLVAMLFVLGGLAKHNEFTAVLAGGIGIHKIAFPLLVVSAFLSAGVFCAQEFVAPRTLSLAREIRENDFLREPQAHPVFDIAQVGRRNRFYFFDVVDVEAGVLTGVHIHTKKDGRLADRIDAERAVWDETAGTWEIQNGVIKEFDSHGLIFKNTPFSICLISSN
ncbi:MAG: LptF/LptG family permease [Candidatus Lindowbacteria bacterium]|nr:LptF/LptG family permease [Candidatus Lindowbacteria bacterium]